PWPHQLLWPEGIGGGIVIVARLRIRGRRRRGLLVLMLMATVVASVFMLILATLFTALPFFVVALVALRESEARRRGQNYHGQQHDDSVSCLLHQPHRLCNRQTILPTAAARHWARQHHPADRIRRKGPGCDPAPSGRLPECRPAPALDDSPRCRSSRCRGTSAPHLPAALPWRKPAPPCGPSGRQAKTLPAVAAARLPARPLLRAAVPATACQSMAKAQVSAIHPAAPWWPASPSSQPRIRGRWPHA